MVNNMSFGDEVDALLQEWKSKGEQTTSPSGVTMEEATQLGFFKEEEDKPQAPPTEEQAPQQEENKLYNEEGERQYQKLGFWQSQGDMLKALGTEASHVLMPKSRELQYESKTHYAETVKQLYRYGVGTLAFMLPTGWIGAGVRGAMLASKIPQLVKAGQFFTNVANPTKAGLQTARAIKAGETGLDIKKSMQKAKLIKGATEGFFAERLADFTLYRPEEGEGHLADILPDNFLSFLQTQEDDSEFDARLKNMLEGTFVGVPIGMAAEFTIVPLAERYLRNIHRLHNAKTPKDAEKAVNDVVDIASQLTAKSETLDLIEQIKVLKTQADETGEELDQLIIDNMPAELQTKARGIGRIINQGEDVYAFNDGTFNIKISNWDEAYKVSQEDYLKQLRDMDSTGNLDITHMNQAVKDTWVNRGWIGEDAELITSTEKKVNGEEVVVKKGDEKLAKKIVKQYKDKWNINNNITVEFIDKLKPKGQYVDGYTEPARNTGKKIKDTQIPIDKKNVQIQELENKIHALEQQADKKQTKSVLSSLKKDVPKLDYVTCRKQWNYWRKSIASPLERAFKDGVDSLNDVIQTMVKNVDEPISVEALEQQLAKGLKDIPTEAQADFYEELYKAVAKVEEYQAKLTPADKLSILKEKLRIAKKEKTGLENPNIAKDISIKISLNAQDPYATLRAELEHARDLANGTVPNQKKQHFSRYKGINEAEVASGYVYKKAQGKHRATTGFNGWYNKSNAASTVGELLDKNIFSNEIEDVQNVVVKHLPEERLSSDTALNETHRLGGKTTVENGQIVIYTNTNLPKAQAEEEIYHELQHARQIQKALNGDAEAAQKLEELAKLIEEGDYEKLKAHPYEQEADLSKEHLKGVKAQYEQRQSQAINNGQVQPNNPVRSDMGRGETQIDTTGNVGTGSRQGELSNSTQANVQPSIITKTTDEIITDLTNGNIELNSVEAIEQVVGQIAKLDVEISGKTFKDVAEDSESFFNKKINEGTVEEALSFIKNLAVQKVEVIDQIVREQIACTKVIGLLKDQLDVADPSHYTNILTSMKNLTTYNKELGSAFGRALVYQKINKEALETFGIHGLSDAAKLGIYTMGDILDRIARQTLNFTRNTPVEIKQLFYKELEQIDPQAYFDLVQDKAFIKFIDREIDNLIYSKNTKDIPKFIKAIQKKLTEEDVNRCAWFVQLADDSKHAMDVVSRYSRATTSYMINNVLGFTSLVKNVASGIVQGVAYPTTKILGGLLTKNYDIAKEGARTLQLDLTNFFESCRLAGKAFKVGDGLMTNTKEIVEGTLDKGFHEWKFDFSDLEASKITLQNLHSLFPRLMMASDELMTQLNYRQVMRAKAKGIADNELQLGKITSAEWADRVDEIFKERAVNSQTGVPLDFKTFAECKEMLFQTPLDRKLYNPNTGKRETVDSTTVLLNAGALGQGIVERIPALRLFFPFIKTPVNIADSVLKSNPIYMALSPDYKAKFCSSDPMVRAKAVGQLAGTVMLYVSGTLAATQGLITGSLPVDTKEKTALLKTGWQPKSIRIGDTYYSYEGLAPYDSIFALCADFVSLSGKVADKQHQMAWNHAFGQAVAYTFSNTVDQAGFRTNIAKLMDLFNPSLDVGRKQTIISTIAGGLLPASANVRDIQTIANGFNKPALEAETFSEKILKNYLPMFLQADYQRDVFGRRMDIHNLLITKATDEDFNTPEYQEMARLAEYGWTPKKIKEVISETRIPFSDFHHKLHGRSANDALGEALYTVKIDRKTLRQAVAELAQSDYYQSLPVGVNAGNGEDWEKTPYDTQVKLMRALFQEYYDEAKNTVILNNDKYVNSEGKTMTEAKEALQAEIAAKTNTFTQLTNL